MSTENPQAAAGTATGETAPKPGGGLPRSISASWGIGHMSAAIGASAINTQIMFFLTDYIGMKPAMAASILVIAKLSDIFTDIVVGFLSDRINTRWGRRRPWVLCGAVLAAVMVAVIFNLNHVPPDMTGLILVGSIILFYVGYTSIHVPLVAMSAELVSDYKASGALWGWGMAINSFGSAVLGISGSAFLVHNLGPGLKGYNAMGVIIAIAVILSGVIFFIGTRHAPRVAFKPAKKKPPMRQWFATLVGNGSLIAFATSEFMSYMGLSMLSVTMTYFLFDIARLGQQGVMVFGTAGLASHFIGMWAIIKLQKWLPKHVLTALAAIGSASVIFMLRGFNEHTGIVAFAAIIAVWGLFSMSRSMMANALATDLIQADALTTGMRREGAIAALVGAIQKTTPAMSTALFGYALSISGYVQGARGQPQPKSAIEMIYLINNVIPGILMLGSAIVLLLFYRLNEKRMKEIEAAAEARGAV